MPQGGYATVVGFVAQDPAFRTTRNGQPVTNVRVGTTPRTRDMATGEWHDGQTMFFDVACWSRLAHHARASLRKGDPVIVKGKFRIKSYEDRAGHLRTTVEITADTLGHDLSRGVANYIRQRPQRPEAEDRPAAGAAGADRASRVTAADPGDMLDEEAIERFGRDLEAGLEAGLDETELDEAGLDEAGLDEAALDGAALDGAGLDDETADDAAAEQGSEGGEDGAAEVTVPPVPAAPF
jgi:single-strand DNA-binding protein